MPIHSEQLERLRGEVKRHSSRMHWFILSAYVCAVPILFAGVILWGPVSWWVLLLFGFVPAIVGQAIWWLSTPDRPRCPRCDADWTHEAFSKWEVCKYCGLALPPSRAEAAWQFTSEAVTASKSDEVTIRAALWLWIGYFRIGSRCGEGWVRWRRGFVEMDCAVTQQSTELRATPYEDLSALVEEQKRRPAKFLGRHGCLVRFADPQPDDSLVVIVAGFAPMRWWPLGNWTVIKGFSVHRGKQAEPLTYEVLDGYW